MRYKKIIAQVVTSVFISSLAMGFTFPVKTTTTTLYDNSIGKGINYKQKLVTVGPTKRVLNIISCDLNSDGSNVIFSKAKDIVKKEEILSKQLQREDFKGNNVVAGINGDMFDMGVGFSSGPQIKDGAIITNHNAKSEENVYPVFGVDKNKKAFITYIHMDAKLMLQSTTPSGIIVTTNGGVNNANEITIDSVNRENCKDKLVLNNYQLNQSGIIDLTPYISRGMSCATVVKGITGPIEIGKEYLGTVDSVGYGAKSAVIPKDGVLLCSSGTKAQWMNSHLKSGDKVKILVNYDKSNINDAIGAYSYFLRNGRVLTNAEMIKAGAKADIVNSRKARTAIGITADNKVIAITVDGGTPSKGASDGITYLEMANTLKSLGAVNGVAMDGGGSTEMNVKLYGENSVSIITKPSDGRERALTNGIVFVSNNERTYKPLSISINGDLNIFKNTNFSYKANGMDTNFNRLDLSNASINWGANSAIGKIDGSGLFTSGNSASSGKITAVFGSKTATSNVKVFTTVPNLKLTDTTLVPLQTNVPREFYLDARDEKGKQIIIGNAGANWSVTGGIGKIDKNGLLTVTEKSGSGTVRAVVGSKIASVKVAIMQASQTIDDFEHNDNIRYVVDGSIGVNGSISKDFSKSGQYSYKISYNYDENWDRKSDGTMSIYPTYGDKAGNDLYSNYTSSQQPKKLGMWVYGDGLAPSLKATLIDGDGNNVTVDMAKAINWVGWKYIDADLPSNIAYPVTLNSIYFSESNRNLHNKGNIYFDDIKFIYSDTVDLKGPAFSGFSLVNDINTKNVKVSVKISDDSGVEKKTILAKIDGKSINASFDETSGILSYSTDNLENGDHSFEVQAMDSLGNVANPAYVSKFTVGGVSDTVVPVISGLLPANNSIIKIATPRISFKTHDDLSGIDVKDISIILDGVKLKAYFDEVSGFACGVLSDPLSAGIHKLAISVSDRAHNKRVLQPISFEVKPISQPKDPNNFTVSMLSDSNGTDFGNAFFTEANTNTSELIIQNGDLVDSDTAAQWIEGLRQIALVKNKPVMLSPGDSEATHGNINNFTKNFGMATYAFEFGNSLFISLNSSIGQSITLSDPTQFDYLQSVLDNNKKQNVFLYTHVPTRDSAGIYHAMPAGDVKKLEDILSAYKKNNEEKNINVIFGHMHAFQSWEVNGVSYTVDGNECLKKSVDPDEGGYMGYTKFAVADSKVTRRYVPLAQNVTVMDSSIVNGEMKVIKGTSKKLQVYGDFSMSSSDYIALMNNIKDVDITWKSDNPSVINVSEDGVISANSIGNANISGTVLDKVFTLKVISVEQKDEYIGGFKIMADTNDVSPDGLVRVQGIGYDIYGNSFEIDNKLIQWKPSKGTVLNGYYAAPIGTLPNDIIEISGQYKTFKAKTTFSENAIKITRRYIKVTASTLNIRETQGVDGKILGVLSLGDRIEVLGEENNWLKVSINNKIGYISKQYTIKE